MTSVAPALVLPVGDANPTRRRPIVTVALVLANVAVFFALQPHGADCPALAFLFEWAAIPRELLSLEPLSQQELAQQLGSSCAAAVGAKQVLVSAFTSMFLHANVAHLLANMLFLWVFGNNVEDRLGHLRYLLFYVLGGLIATYAFAVVFPMTAQPLLGASGAIAAVLGAYLVLYPRARVHTYMPFPLYLLSVLPGIRMTGFFLIFAIVTMPAWLVLGGWFALQVAAARSPASDGVAYVAHAGGFVAGMLLLAFLDRRRRRRGYDPWRVSG